MLDYAESFQNGSRQGDSSGLVDARVALSDDLWIDSSALKSKSANLKQVAQASSEMKCSDNTKHSSIHK